jgi:hypothetical protein
MVAVKAVVPVNPGSSPGIGVDMKRAAIICLGAKNNLPHTLRRPSKTIIAFLRVSASVVDLLL